MRRGFALSWQHLAHGCYPYDPALAERALARARALHPVAIRPERRTRLSGCLTVDRLAGRPSTSGRVRPTLKQWSRYASQYGEL